MRAWGKPMPSMKQHTVDHGQVEFQVVAHQGRLPMKCIRRIMASSALMPWATSCARRRCTRTLSADTTLWAHQQFSRSLGRDAVALDALRRWK